MIQRGGAQLRLSAQGRVVGFDILALSTIAAALGYDAQALLLLFHHAESGLLQAIQHGNEQHQEPVDPNHGGWG